MAGVSGTSAAAASASRAPLQLVVGLGNPGPDHAADRHNVGVHFLQHLCQRHGGQLRNENKFFGEFGTSSVSGTDLKLLFPTTYMNHSGKAVAAVCKFFKIPPSAMLVAYDEIDFPTGTVRLKLGGGHGGHNGVRDIINALGGQRDFPRLRIGVGHPGHKSMVVDYVLSSPSRSESTVITECINNALDVLPVAVTGNWSEAMKALHSSPEPDIQKP